MQRVGTARPALVSSVSRLCRYSTDKPSQPRHLVTEWGGIVIPSRKEIHENKEKEKIRKREETKTDLSYLKNASNNSLAARLARRKDAAPAQPEPTVESISPEILAENIRKRKEIRLAREKAEAEAAMRLYTPNAAFSKSLESAAANYQPTPKTMARKESPQTNNDRFQRGNTPQIYNALPNDRTLAPIKRGFDNAPESSIVEVQNELQRQNDFSTSESPTLAETSQSVSINEASALNDLRRNRRDRMTTSQVKRTEQRLRDGLLQENQIPKTLRTGLHNRTKFVLKDSHLADINKRRQARLDREQATEGKEKLRSERRIRKGPNTRLARRQDDDEDANRIAAAIANEDPAYHTGPEPISPALTDIFKGTTAFRSAGFKGVGIRRAGLKKENYSLYVPESTSALFSVPASELSAVDMANVVLSHRADFSIQKRHIAIDLVEAALRPRSVSVQAKA